MRLQKMWIDRSKNFSTVWQRTLLENPDLNPLATSFSTSHYGRQIQKRIKEGEKDQLIASLKDSYGLFFFFDNSIPSQAFSKIVKSFSERHKWTVVAISSDNERSTVFPKVLPDNGIVNLFGVTVLPSLYVANPASKDFRPVAYGMSSLEEIEKNILIQFSRENP